jgi:hypothetical protein
MIFLFGLYFGEEEELLEEEEDEELLLELEEDSSLIFPLKVSSLSITLEVRIFTFINSSRENSVGSIMSCF